LRSAREARELLVELEVDMSLLDVPDDVVELGDVLLLELGDVVDRLLELDGLVVVLVLDDVDGLGEVLVEELGDVLVEELGDVLVVELGDVLVELLVPLVELGDVPEVPDVVEPVAPVPDVPAAVPELLERVSDEPAALEPCEVAAPVELESALPVPVPVLCAYDSAAIDAIARAVKVFGNLLMKSPVAE
jgi:hypothetical protein